MLNWRVGLGRLLMHRDHRDVGLQNGLMIFSDKEIRCIVIAMFDDDHRLIIMENHTFTFNVANVKA